MKKIMLIASLISVNSWAAENYVSGKVTSLKGHRSEPAIRIGSNLVPDACDGGTYGWLYFSGTAQEKQWVYATAITMAVVGKNMTVYTNSDGETCRIYDIQIKLSMD